MKNERERLMRSHENLVSQLEEEKLKLEEVRKSAYEWHHSREVEDRVARRQDEETRLVALLKEEAVRMSALLERERAARADEVERWGDIYIYMGRYLCIPLSRCSGAFFEGFCMMMVDFYFRNVYCFIQRRDVITSTTL